MKHTAILLLSLFLFSCDDSEMLTQAEVPSIKYGTSFGMCGGYCITDVEVTAQSFYISQYGWNDSVTPKSKTTSFEEEKYNQLLAKVDQTKFLALDPVIGCPDCADGGAEWVEVTIGARTKKVTFGYGTDIDGISNAVSELRDLTQNLSQ